MSTTFETEMQNLRAQAIAAEKAGDTDKAAALNKERKQRINVHLNMKPDAYVGLIGDYKEPALEHGPQSPLATPVAPAHGRQIRSKPNLHEQETWVSRNFAKRSSPEPRTVMDQATGARQTWPHRG